MIGIDTIRCIIIQQPTERRAFFTQNQRGQTQRHVHRDKRREEMNICI